MYIFCSFCAAGGAGAVTGYDGYQCACDMGTLGVVGKTDAEEEMARFPWHIEQYEFRTDSHGPGRWRGAPGIVWEAVNEAGDAYFGLGSSSGFSTQAKGQHGGGDTPANQAFIRRGTELIEITEPHRDARLRAGDHVITLTGGGAGVGRPQERDPEAVLMDVVNELVSVSMARDVYKVVVDAETLQVDLEATQKLRSAG
jgi:N-methylhydantoinase B